MMGMTEPPRRQLPRWASTLVVVVVAVLLLTPGPWRELEKVGSSVLSPIQLGVSGTIGEVSSVFGTLQRVRDLATQNADYREEIDRLESELVRLRELEVENTDLRNLLGLKERTRPGTLLPVSVIGRDDTAYAQAITVDRGTTGGVVEGTVIVTHKGLVGRVVKANPLSAKVMLLNDINSSVAIRLQSDTRATGILRGQSQGNSLVVVHIPQTDVIKVGDVVITSGIGEVYPEGLVVGKVTRVERNEADPFQAAAVEPAVDMNKLERLYALAEEK